MTDKVVSLKVGAPARPKDEPNPFIVESLERLLAEAKTGRLQFFWGTGLCSDEHVMSVHSWGCQDHYRVIGILEALKWDYMAGPTDDE